MAAKSTTVTWDEGPGADAAVEPAIDVNGLRRVVVQVTDPAYPAGWIGYVPDDDAVVAKTVLDVWAALGKP